MGHPSNAGRAGRGGARAGPGGPVRTEGVALTARLAYRPVLVVATCGAAALVNTALAPVTRTRPFRQDVVLTGLAAAAAVAVIVLAVKRIALGVRPAPAALPGFLGMLIAITLAINALIALGFRAGKAERAGTAPPPIHERLPLDQRGALVALSVEDHYVRVQTHGVRRCC